MKIRILTTDTVEEKETSYALRLMDQGLAVPEPETGKKATVTAVEKLPETEAEPEAEAERPAAAKPAKGRKNK